MSKEDSLIKSLGCLIVTAIFVLSIYCLYSSFLMNPRILHTFVVIVISLCSLIAYICFTYRICIDEVF